MSGKALAFNIVIHTYEQANLFDVTSACEMFYWMAQLWNGREVSVELSGAGGREVGTHAGPRLAHDKSFDD